MEAGELYQTYAEVNALFDAVGYKSKVTVEQGVAEFVKW
jgi:UDP-glucuronate 4-epimerase